MNLINSAIITDKNDALWSDVSFLISDAAIRPVLVITREFETGSAEETQLKKMVETACKLMPDQYHLICLKQAQMAAWHRLRELLQPRFIFLIGIAPAQLGISAMFRINEANKFDDRIWLPTVSLNELEQQPTVKTQLWNNGMKPIFVEKKFGAI